MKLILLFLAIVTTLDVFAQGFNKKVPVKMDRTDIGLYSNTDFTGNTAAKNVFVNGRKLTVEQLEKAMTLAQEANFPEGINDVKEQIAHEKDITNYKAYWQGSWLQTNATEGWAQKMNLIWIPKEDNSHMPADMVPTDKDGMFFVVNNHGITIDSLPKSPVPATAFITEMKKKHSKLQPAVIDSAYNKVMSGYGQNMEFAYDLLSVKGRYSDAEYARITELANDIYWPKPFITRKYDAAHKQAFADITKYKTYKVATFNDSWNKVDLYWVPKEENRHMPAEMQPVTDEGFFIATKVASEDNSYLAFMLKGSTPRGRLNYSIAGKPGKSTASSPLAMMSAKPTTTSANTTSTKPNDNKQSDVVRSASQEPATLAIKSDGTNEGSVQHKNRKRMYITDGTTAWTMANLNNEAIAKTALEASGLYNSRDFAQIAMLAHESRYPDALSTYMVRQLNMEMARNYNAYQVANFTTSYAPYILMWIPKSENTHMPKEMQPASDDGFYMLVQQKGVSETRLGSSMSVAQGMENTGKSYTTSSGIQVSSADMSQFTNNRKLGTMMLYYGYGGKASSIYMYELRGKELTDKQKVASELASKTSGGTFIGFEWLAGYDCNMAKGFVYKKTNSTDGTRCMGEYKID